MGCLHCPRICASRTFIFTGTNCVEFNFKEGLGKVLGIHLHPNAIEIPQGLEREKVCLTILYEWFKVFMLARWEMRDEIASKMDRMQYGGTEKCEEK